MNIGLRVDVDTFRGTRRGVPALCTALARRGFSASFFFSVGPDNMGRHVRRLINPKFMWKMLRSNGAKLYGWDILLRGTFFPGPLIAAKLGTVIRHAAEMGHEMGLHAWDHHHWQKKIEVMTQDNIRAELRRGFEALQGLGIDVVASAVPAWQCTEAVLVEKMAYPLAYNSDCRGSGIFMPWVNGRVLEQPQIPVSLPTFDELIGRNGIHTGNYNHHLLSLVQPDRLNVLAIHAEVEGIVYLELFERFMTLAERRGFRFVPLGSLLKDGQCHPVKKLTRQTISGREGWLSWEGSQHAG